MVSFVLGRSLSPTAARMLEQDADRELLLERLARVKREPVRLLNVDCGDGLLLRRALRWFPGTAMTGTDPRVSSLDRASATVRHARFLHADSRALPICDQTFDMAALLVGAPADRDTWWSQLRELRRVLADGGVLGLAGPVVSVPPDWLHQLGMTVLDMRMRPGNDYREPLALLVLGAYRPAIRSL